MKKEKRNYSVSVGDLHLCTTYCVSAASAREAKSKAKEKFIKEFYNPSKVKSSVNYVESI